MNAAGGRRGVACAGNRIVDQVSASFDFGPRCAERDTPLTRAVVATSVAFSPDAPFTTRYAIAVVAL